MKLMRGTLLTTPMGVGTIVSLVGHTAVFMALHSSAGPAVEAPVFGVQQSDAAFTVSIAFEAEEVEQRITKRVEEVLDDSAGSFVVRQKPQKKKVERDTASKQQAQTSSNASEGDASATTRHAAPAYASNPPPIYPESARRAGHEGLAKLLVTVDIYGAASGVRIVQSSGSAALDEAAVSAVEDWTFRPGSVNGQPVETSVEVPIRFSLSSEGSNHG